MSSLPTAGERERNAGQATRSGSKSTALHTRPAYRGFPTKSFSMRIPRGAGDTARQDRTRAHGTRDEGPTTCSRTRRDGWPPSHVTRTLRGALARPTPAGNTQLVDYAISAGTLVLRGGRILLVRHSAREDSFWLPPGGRLRGNESIFDCAARETREETGLRVVPQRIVYVEEFIEADLHFCKFWLLAPDPGGSVTIAGRDADETHLVDVRFFAREELRGLRAYPSILQATFWDDLACGFPVTRYLGLQRIGGR